MKETTYVIRMEVTNTVPGDHGKVYHEEDLRELGEKLAKDYGVDKIDVKSYKTFVMDK